jgi:hypothetical protein
MYAREELDDLSTGSYLRSHVWLYVHTRTFVSIDGEAISGMQVSRKDTRYSPSNVSYALYEYKYILSLHPYLSSNTTVAGQKRSASILY